MTAYGLDEFSTVITFSVVTTSLFHAITKVSFCSDISLSRSFPPILAYSSNFGIFFRNIRVAAFRHYIETGVYSALHPTGTMGSFRGNESDGTVAEHSSGKCQD
jgi:hypothetical protein